MSTVYLDTEVTVVRAASARTLAREGNPLHRWGLVPILVLYFCLAFHQIDHQSLWVDEIFTVTAAGQNSSLLAYERWFGGRGPLYLLLIQLWPGWGDVEFAYRSFSVLLGGIIVCLAYFLARRFLGNRVAWISTLLFATSPFLIWYSQEARYVTLAMATALLAIYCFLRALSRNRAFDWWVYGGSIVLATAAFVVNLVIPAAHLLYVLGARAGRRSLRQCILPYAAVFLIFLWWANDGQLQQLGGYWLRLSVSIAAERPQSPGFADVKPLNVGGLRGSNIFELPYTFFAFSTGFSLGPSVRDLQLSRSLATLRPHIAVLGLTGLLFGTLFLYGLIYFRRVGQVGRILTHCLAIPIAVTIVIAALFPGLAYNVRYVSMAFPAYLFVLAAGIASFRHPNMRIAALGAVLLVNGTSLANYYYSSHYARDDARSAARYLEAAGGYSDVIVVVGSSLPLEYYYKGSMPVRLFNSRDFEADAIRYLEELRRGYDRLWLVEIRPWEAGPNRALQTTLNNLTYSSEHKQFSGVDIYAYELPG